MTTLTPAAVFPVPGTPDWQVMTEDAVWVSNGPKNTIHRLDAKTIQVVAAIEVGKRPCSGLAAGFGSVWIPVCGDRPGTENGARPALTRVDIKTNQVTASIPVGPANSEGGLVASPEARVGHGVSDSTVEDRSGDESSGEAVGGRRRRLGACRARVAMALEFARAECVADRFDAALSCGSTIEDDPGGSVVTRIFLAANPAVYASVHEMVADSRREKEMIQPHTLV